MSGVSTWQFEMKSSLKTLRDQAELLSIKQTGRFENLNRKTRDIVGAILDSIYSNISRDIKLQTEAIAQVLNRGEVVVTDSATADCRVIDTNTKPGESEPKIGAQNLEILAELRQREDAIRSSMTKSIIDSLQFPEIIEPYEGVAEAHKRTFLWLYESEGLNKSGWDSFTNRLEYGDGLYWINGKLARGNQP